MIFGRPEAFAIEAYDDRTTESPSGLWGRSCVHVQGRVIGSINESHCGLDSFADSLADILGQMVSLSDPCFGAMDDSEVFLFLDRKLYFDEGQSLDRMSEDWGRYGKFCFLTNCGEQFDGWKAFIFLRPDGILRIVSRENERRIEVGLVARSTFEIVVASFLEWIEAERERVNVP